MFHVEPKSENYLKNFEKCLKQRNFLLKSTQSHTNNHWNEQLIATNTILGECRENYFNLLNKEFRKIIDDLKRRYQRSMMTYHR